MERFNMIEPYRMLEQKWAQQHHDNPLAMVACNSGTAALHLAFECLKLPTGSKVIVPDYAMISCARAVVMAGLEPVFVDCGEDLLVDPGCVADAIDDGARAILAVHNYGRRCDMDSLTTLAAKHDLFTVEDLAEAHGVGFHAWTDVACWSFYRNKIVAGEEGGAVLFADLARADHARRLRSMGFGPDQDYTHIPRGCNYRLANSLASLILDSLDYIGDNLRRRRKCEGLYNARVPENWKSEHHRDVVWVYDIQVPGMTPAVQNAAVIALKEQGVQARHGFKPLSQQAEFHGCKRVGGQNSFAASREVIYLPVYLDDRPEEKVVDAVAILREVLADFL